MGVRTNALNYATDPYASIDPTQRFTGKERDEETGLDYFGARYFSGVQGRFTGPDAPFADQKETDPQSWNMYAYVRNKPLSYRDPDGRALDTILDIGFIAYDLYVIATEGATETNVAALGADVVGASIPFATGAGVAVRAAKAADKMADGGKAASKVNKVREGAKAAENTAKNADNAAKGAEAGSIYKVPGEATPSGKPYIGRHNKPEPQKTRASTDGRDRTKAEVIDTYDQSKPMEGRVKEQAAIDAEGGVPNLDNKRNEIRKKE